MTKKTVETTDPQIISLAKKKDEAFISSGEPEQDFIMTPNQAIQDITKILEGLE